MEGLISGDTHLQRFLVRLSLLASFTSALGNRGDVSVAASAGGLASVSCVDIMVITWDDRTRLCIETKHHGPRRSGYPKEVLMRYSIRLDSYWNTASCTLQQRRLVRGRPLDRCFQHGVRLGIQFPKQICKISIAAQAVEIYPFGVSEYVFRD